MDAQAELIFELTQLGVYDDVRFMGLGSLAFYRVRPYHVGLHLVRIS